MPKANSDKHALPPIYIYFVPFHITDKSVCDEGKQKSNKALLSHDPRHEVYPFPSPEPPLQHFRGFDEKNSDAPRRKQPAGFILMKYRATNLLAINFMVWVLSQIPPTPSHPSPFSPLFMSGREKWCTSSCFLSGRCPSVVERNTAPHQLQSDISNP